MRELDRFFDEADAYSRARASGSSSAPLVPAWEAMLPYVKGELPVFVHANEARQIRAVLKWVQRRGLKAVLVGGRDAWKLADELAKAGIPVVYEAVHDLPEDELDGYDIQLKAPALLTAAGVKVAISLGSNMEESRARNLPYDASQALAYGLDAEEALKSVTLYPAQILGVADRLGSIEAGKEASLVVLDGDLLDIRSQVKRLWIAGREVPIESHHTRLYQKYRNRPR
jgi:imidazolonepropionase-like amidohydrolase